MDSHHLLRIMAHGTASHRGRLIESGCIELRALHGRDRKGLPSNLLSDHVCIVACFDFEGTIVGPEVD